MNNAVPLLYNPREASPDVLEQMFVGREEVLRELQDDLVAQIGSATRQHWLVRGPRGMGKTHLIALLCHRIRREHELNRSLLPVWLGEAEAYEAYSAGMLMLAIAESLIGELSKAGDTEVSALRAAVDAIGHAGDDPALFNDLRHALKQEAERRGKILVVLMENLDVWLENASGSKADVEAGRLRALLSDDKEFLFISTTPTHYLPRLSKPSSPLYGHLRERRLQPISEEDVRELFDRLKKLTGREVEFDDDASRPHARVRWRVLHRLAGGNPRAAVMAFSVMSGAPGIRAMVDEFGRLLDAQTAYYEARLARLAPRERAIVKALALSPTNLTVSQIAAITRLPERSLSTQIKRLLDEGHLARVGDHQGKGSVFELTDGLFRVWHHYRSGRRMLEPLVRFLALFQTETEIEAALRETAAHLAGSSSPLESDLLSATARQLRAALDCARSPDFAAQRERLWRQCQAEIAAADLDALLKHLRDLGETGGLSDNATAQSDARRAVATYSHGQSSMPEHAVLMLVMAAAIHAELGQGPRAAEIIQDALARSVALTPRLTTLTALATAMICVHLTKSDRDERTVTILSRIVSRLDDGFDASAREATARARLHVAIALGEAGRVDDEIAGYRDLIDRFRDSDEIPVCEYVARAMHNLAVTLSGRGRIADSVAVHTALIARFSESSETVLSEFVGRALFNIGFALRELGRTQESLTAYADFIRRFGESRSPVLEEGIAHAMFNIGLTLGEVGRTDESAAVFRELIARFEHRSEDVFREDVAHAKLNLGRTLRDMGRERESLEAFRDIVGHYSETTEETTVRITAARAAVSAAAMLISAGQFAEACTIARCAFDICASLPEEQSLPISVELVLAASLDALRRHDESRDVLTDAATRLGAGSHTDLGTAESVVRGLLTHVPLSDAEHLISQITIGAQPEIAEMARLYKFVLQVLQAEEPAAGKVKLGPAARRRRALVHVPPGLRETVIEKAEIIKKVRATITGSDPV